MAISSVIPSLQEVPHRFNTYSPQMQLTHTQLQFGSLPIDALPSEKVLLNVGDVVIKVRGFLLAITNGRRAVTVAVMQDMRCFHRGTANRSNEPRPMLSLIYSRKWYRLPYGTYPHLSSLHLS